MTGPSLWVSGVDADGAERFRSRLPHGTDPEHLLAGAGFAPLDVRAVHAQSNPYTLVLEYAVRLVAGPPPSPARQDPWRDPDLVVEPGEEPVRRQRVAVYTWCRSERGLLLTQFSDRTNVAGQWGPPGGGLDAGELPEPALHREVFEETGQQIEVEGLLGVFDGRWVGRAPNGRLEDFHAVRLIYLGHCPEPTEPVVHDVGGTTLTAAWVPFEQIDYEALATLWARSLAAHAAAMTATGLGTGADRASRPPRPGPAEHPPR